MGGKHPATYSKKVLDVVGPILLAEWARLPAWTIRMLDPMAGVGKCFLLDIPGKVEFTAIDLDPDWEDQDPRVIRGNALNLPFADDTFHGIFVSPVYGNRMGDHHENKDPCSKCRGSGMEDPRLHGALAVACSKCKGSGLSPRNTYFHRLGREVSAGSSCYLQWDDGSVENGKAAYQDFHVEAWREASRVATSLFVLNVSNHIRQHEEQFVAEWHREVMLGLGWLLDLAIPVKTPRNRFGANGEVRVAQEWVYVFRR
jgi:hypothetical protein